MYIHLLKSTIFGVDNIKIIATHEESEKVVSIHKALYETDVEITTFGLKSEELAHDVFNSELTSKYLDSVTRNEKEFSYFHQYKLSNYQPLHRIIDHLNEIAENVKIIKNANSVEKLVKCEDITIEGTNQKFISVTSLDIDNDNIDNDNIETEYSEVEMPKVTALDSDTTSETNVDEEDSEDSTDVSDTNDINEEENPKPVTESEEFRQLEKDTEEKKTAPAEVINFELKANEPTFGCTNLVSTEPTKKNLTKVLNAQLRPDPELKSSEPVTPYDQCSEPSVGAYDPNDKFASYPNVYGEDNNANSATECESEDESVEYDESRSVTVGLIENEYLGTSILCYDSEILEQIIKKDYLSEFKIISEIVVPNLESDEDIEMCKKVIATYYAKKAKPVMVNCSRDIDSIKTELKRHKLKSHDFEKLIDKVKDFISEMNEVSNPKIIRKPGNERIEHLQRYSVRSFVLHACEKQDGCKMSSTALYDKFLAYIRSRFPGYQNYFNKNTFTPLMKKYFETKREKEGIVWLNIGVKPKAFMVSLDTDIDSYPCATKQSNLSVHQKMGIGSGVDSIFANRVMNDMLVTENHPNKELVGKDKGSIEFTRETGMPFDGYNPGPMKGLIKTQYGCVIGINSANNVMANESLSTNLSKLSSIREEDSKNKCFKKMSPIAKTVSNAIDNFQEVKFGSHLQEQTCKLFKMHVDDDQKEASKLDSEDARLQKDDTEQSTSSKWLSSYVIREMEPLPKVHPTEMSMIAERKMEPYIIEPVTRTISNARIIKNTKSMKTNKPKSNIKPKERKLSRPIIPDTSDSDEEHSVPNSATKSNTKMPSKLNTTHNKIISGLRSVRFPTYQISAPTHKNREDADNEANKSEK